MGWDFSGLEELERKPQIQTTIPAPHEQWDFSGLEELQSGASQPAMTPANVTSPQNVITAMQGEAPPLKTTNVKGLLGKFFEKRKTSPVSIEETIGRGLLKEAGKFDLGQKINKKLKEYARKELQSFKKRSPTGYKQMYGDLSVDKAFEKYWNERVQPAKTFILNAIKGFTAGAAADDEITKKLTEKHPFVGAAGEIGGTVASYLTGAKFLELLGMPALAAKIGMPLAGKISFAPRILPKAIMNASIWGGHKAVEETVKAMKQHKANPYEAGKNILKDTAFGAAIGALGGISKIPAIISAYGLGYINAKSSGAKDPEAHLQGAIWALTEGVGAYGRDKQLRKEALSLLTESFKDSAMKLNPELSEEQALKAAQEVIGKAIEANGGLDKVLSDKKYTVRVFEKLNKALRRAIEKDQIKRMPEMRTVKPKTGIEYEQPKIEQKKRDIEKEAFEKFGKTIEGESGKYMISPKIEEIKTPDGKTIKIRKFYAYDENGKQVFEVDKKNGKWVKVETVKPEPTKPIEPIKPKKVPSKTVKEPWEMTKEEYWERPEAMVFKKSPTGKKMSVWMANKLKNEYMAIHKQMVQLALNRGKPVPEEVLAEYPDLAKKYGGKTVNSKEATTFILPKIDILDLGLFHGIVGKKRNIGLNIRLGESQNLKALKHELGHIIEQDFNLKDNDSIIDEFNMSEDVRAKEINREEAVAEAINQIILGNKEVINKHPKLVAFLKEKLPNLKEIVSELESQVHAFWQKPDLTKILKRKKTISKKEKTKKKTTSQKTKEKLPKIEKPSSEANAYKIEKSDSEIKKEVQEEMKDIYGKEIKFHAGIELPLKIEHFKNISNKIKEGVRALNEPVRDIVRSVAGAIEKWRANVKKAELYADWAKKAGYSIEKNAKNLEIIDRYLDNPEKYKEEFDKLPAHSKKLYELLKKDYEEMRELANELGILESWQENYTPHMYRDHWTKVRKMLYPQGGKLGTKFKFGKRRVFKTIDEAEEAGLHPITDPVLKNAIYKYQLYRTIANKNLIETLKLLKREDGLPLLMAKPRNKEKLRIWENEYKWVNVPSLQRFMYVGKAGEKPMLASMPVKADPEIANLLNNAFSPWAERHIIYRMFTALSNKARKLILINPSIHGWNIFSDVLDEMNFNLYKTLHIFKRGKQLYEKKDALVEWAVDSGLNLQNSFDIAREIKRYLLQGLSKEEQNALQKILKPINKLEQMSDDVLWGFVKHAQLGLFEALTQKVAKEHPDWDKEKVGKVVAHYINTLLGTIPHTWFSKFGREAGSIMLFAKNWTLSNLDMVLKAVLGGKRGLGTKVLSEDEQQQIARDFTKHLLKGVFGLLAFANLLQLGFLAITNKMKEDGIIKGKKKPLHLSFANEKGHWYDVDTGLISTKGQPLYLVPPIFRYIRDYIGWITEPRKTLYNKLNPVVKTFAETFIFNYNAWKQKKIVEDNDPKFEKLRKLAEYWVKSLTPAHILMTEPGEVRTKFEWIIPITGMWIRRGAPGGKFAKLLFDYEAQKKYDIDKTDKKIDELLQKKQFIDAIKLMDKTERYSSKRGQAFRIMKFVTPLNYYWRKATQKDKEGFLQELKKRGYSEDDFKKALKEELKNVREVILSEDKKGEEK